MALTKVFAQWDERHHACPNICGVGRSWQQLLLFSGNILFSNISLGGALCAKVEPRHNKIHVHGVRRDKNFVKIRRSGGKLLVARWRTDKVKWNVAISACCILLLAANIALLRQNRQLKSQLSLPPPTLEAAPGTPMPALRGFDAAGKPLEVLYGKDPRKVLVLAFSPTCGFCDENWPKWRQLIPALDKAAVRPVAVDVTATAQPAFVSLHQLADVPFFVQVDPQAVLSYRFHLTPQTILVDRDGKVEKVWTGVLNDSALAELKRLLGDSKSATYIPSKRPAF